MLISDGNHGILEGVWSVFPESPHVLCYVNLKANLKDRVRGYRKVIRKSILKHFGRCAYATTKSEYEKMGSEFQECPGGGEDGCISRRNFK